MHFDRRALWTHVACALVVLDHLEALLVADMVLRMVMATGNTVVVVEILWFLKIDSFLEELSNLFVSVLRDALDLVDECAIFHKVDLRHVRDLQISIKNGD